MRVRTGVRRAGVFGCLVMSAVWVAGRAEAQWEAQELRLEPGWNAVFLEVAPEPSACAAVFADLPVTSVWTWNPELPGPRFLRNPDVLLPEQPEWLTWFPPESPHAFMSDLAAVLGGRAYLIQLRGAEAVTWTVFGRLAAPKQARWSPDAFNLVGAYVDPDAPPSFASYFGVSKAHRSRPVYRLSEAGAWVGVDQPASTPMRQGEAYWVYCEGESDFSGPVEADCPAKSWGVRFDSGTRAFCSAVRALPASPASVSAAASAMFSSACKRAFSVPR